MGTESKRILINHARWPSCRRIYPEVLLGLFLFQLKELALEVVNNPMDERWGKCLEATSQHSWNGLEDVLGGFIHDVYG